MPSVFDTRFAEVAAPVLENQFGVVVSIKRGSLTTTGVTAIKINGERKINLDDGNWLNAYDAQWIVVKTRYKVAGVAVNPKSGDRIIDAEGQHWELKPIDDMSEVDDRDGGYEWLLRTKRVGA